MVELEPITSLPVLCTLVEEIGFLPFFTNPVEGFSVEEHTPRSLWFVKGVDGPWEWKGPSIQATGCAYGKFFRHKAGWISRRWFADFANARGALWEAPRAIAPGSAEAAILDILDELGEANTKVLKPALQQYLPGFKGFDAALTRLQMQGLVVTVGFDYPKTRQGASYGWGLSRLANAQTHFGAELFGALGHRTPQQSRERIVQHLQKVLPEASDKSILRLLS